MTSERSEAAAVWERQVRRSVRQSRRPLRILSAFLVAALAVPLAYVAVDLAGRKPGGLTPLAMARLDESGVTNPVTAVLLNFRSIDTWLELGVLVVAAMGVFALQRASALVHLPRAQRGGFVLLRMAGIFVPVMIIASGYILWQGTHEPGGAFQAGALLAAAGVILRLSGRHAIRPLPGWLSRCAIIFSFAAFGLAGVSFMLAGRRFMAYPGPPATAGEWIFLIELAAALSIGFGLWALFLGAHPATWRGERRPEQEH